MCVCGGEDGGCNLLLWFVDIDSHHPLSRSCLEITLPSGGLQCRGDGVERKRSNDMHTKLYIYFFLTYFFLTFFGWGWRRFFVFVCLFVLPAGLAIYHRCHYNCVKEHVLLGEVVMVLWGKVAVLICRWDNASCYYASACDVTLHTCPAYCKNKICTAHGIWMKMYTSCNVFMKVVTVFIKMKTMCTGVFMKAVTVFIKTVHRCLWEVFTVFIKMKTVHMCLQ